jgi:hypothetical protein
MSSADEDEAALIPREIIDDLVPVIRRATPPIVACGKLLFGVVRGGLCFACEPNHEPFFDKTVMKLSPGTCNDAFKYCDPMMKALEVLKNDLMDLAIKYIDQIASNEDEKITVVAMVKEIKSLPICEVLGSLKLNGNNGVVQDEKECRGFICEDLVGGAIGSTPWLNQDDSVAALFSRLLAVGVASRSGRRGLAAELAREGLGGGRGSAFAKIGRSLAAVVLKPLAAASRAQKMISLSSVSSSSSSSPSSASAPASTPSTTSSAVPQPAVDPVDPGEVLLIEDIIYSEGGYEAVQIGCSYSIQSYKTAQCPRGNAPTMARGGGKWSGGAVAGAIIVTLLLIAAGALAIFYVVKRAKAQALRGPGPSIRQHVQLDESDQPALLQETQI